MAVDSALFEKFGRSLSPGQVIFHEGDEGDQMYIIQSGKVRISKRISERDHVLAVLAKGDFFGEMAIINNVQRTATATAVTDVNLLCFNRSGFTNMINKNAQIALSIIDKLCRRLQNMNMQIQHLVKRNSRGLIALNLLYAFKELPELTQGLYLERTVEEMSLGLELPKTRIESQLRSFCDDKIIEIEGNKIYLNSMDGLSDITESFADS